MLKARVIFDIFAEYGVGSGPIGAPEKNRSNTRLKSKFPEIIFSFFNFPFVSYTTAGEEKKHTHKADDEGAEYC